MAAAFPGFRSVMLPLVGGPADGGLLNAVEVDGELARATTYYLGEHRYVLDVDARTWVYSPE